MSTVKADYLVNAAGTGAPTLTNGAVLPAGSAAAPAISPTGDTNTGIFFPAADTIAFAEGGAEAMRIDSSGNVGVGVTSTGAKFDVSATGQTTARFIGTGGTYVGIANQTTYSSASVYSGVYYDLRNELGNTVANFLGDVNADGSSGWVWTTQPSGARTDRRVDAMRVTGTGLLQFNSGYGSAATAYGCRAWVNFNGTGTVAIRASGNVSSITDNGTGDYTVNFTTAMPDADYSVTGMVGITALVRLARYNSLTTSQIQNITVVNTSNSATDAAAVTIAVFR